MIDWLTSAFGAIAMLPAAVAASWIARWTIRTMTRRAVRRAQRSKGSWRVRLDRLADNGQIDARKRQRADAAAHMLGHFITGLIFVIATFMALHFVGVQPLVALSSAGFIGVALAFGGQELIKDMIAGTTALLEDRYAAGDDVIFLVSGQPISGIVDLIGAASVRLRSADGAMWHVGHNKIESVTNLSQLPSISDIEVPASTWQHADDAAVANLLTASSNDVGLTGVVFLRDIETFGAERADDATLPLPTDTITVRVKTNRPLSQSEADVIKAKLLP